jgi:glycosyltransferase involved in cell wall biosynthesis
MKIAVIIPYLPDFRTMALFARCLNSVDSRFRVFDSVDKMHEGVAVMRNKGLSYIFDFYPDTDYITFLDADDTYAPDAYDQMLKAIEEAPDANIIQLAHVREFPDGRTQQRLPSPSGDYGLDRLPNLWVSVCIKLFKADLIRNIRFKPELCHGEDELFMLEALKIARGIHVSRRVALHYHKDNPNSLSTTTSLENLLGEQKALCEFADAHKDDSELLKAVRQRQSELWNNACYKRVFGG